MFWKIALIEFVLILVISISGIAYFRYNESHIAVLQGNAAKLETAVNTLSETVTEQQKETQRQNTQIVILQQNIADAETQRRDFEEKLRQKDISSMAHNNPSDLEIRINRATTKAFQDIVNLTSPKDQPAAQMSKPSDLSGSLQPPPHPPKDYKKLESKLP
jgi:chromosome segregation ATPase